MSFNRVTWKREDMTKSIEEYYAIWQSARRAFRRFSVMLDTEDLADEQFVIQQHAITMMAKVPAKNRDEVFMKVRVAMLEAGIDPDSLGDIPDDQKLKGAILRELDSFLRFHDAESQVSELA